jgi:hypothetical protein
MILSVALALAGLRKHESTSTSKRQTMILPHRETVCILLMGSLSVLRYLRSSRGAKHAFEAPVFFVVNTLTAEGPRKHGTPDH